MVDPLDLNNESALEGFLRWLGRPGSAVRNVLKGNVGGAVRQAADFFLDPIDAVLPGDLLPQMSQKDDFTEASDLIGGMDPGWAKTGADIAGGILTDPLTYIGVGPALKLGTAPLRIGAELGANLASKTEMGAKAVTGAKELGKEALYQVQRATGNVPISAPLKDAFAAGGAKGAATSRAGQEFAVPTFSAIDPVAQRRGYELTRGITSETPTGAYDDLDALLSAKQGSAYKPSAPFIDKAEQMARIDARLSLMPWSAAEKAAARDAAEKANDFTRTMWAQGIDDTVFSRPEMYTDANGALHTVEDLTALHANNPAVANVPFDQWAQGMGFTKSLVPTTHAPADYLPGAYERVIADAEGAGSPSFLHAKSLADSGKLSKWLNENKDKVKLDTDLPTLLGDYAARMGTAVKQAEIGKRISPGFRTLADDRGMFKTLSDNLRAAGKKGEAEALDVAIQGLPPREGLWKIMADFNSKIFKPFATGGAFLPRAAFTTRNVVSGAAMTASNPEARGAALSQLARAPKDVLGAWSDGLRDLGIPMPKPEHIKQVDDAIARSGGSREKMLAGITDPTIRGAVEHGVIGSGFVSSEKMGADLAQKANGIKDWKNWRDWPQGVVRGAEDRMRFGLYSKLVADGMPEAQAAKVVKDSLYDYAYSSTLNRTMRDIIPFFQFPAKAVPQQAKFLMETGIVPSIGRNTIEKLYSQGNDQILPPQLQDQPVIPFGQDEKGNPSYLTSFGMPWESLGQIPNLTGDLADIGPEIRQNLVSSANPLLKTAYSAISGEDPYFGSKFGSFDKAPFIAQELGADPTSSGARAYNILAGSGAIQPLASPVNTLSGLLDPRRTAGETALNSLTGVRVKSVDEDAAMRQLLEGALDKNPNVQSYSALYQKSPDTETQAMLAELKNVKSRIRQKREAVDVLTDGAAPTLNGVEPAKPPPLDGAALSSAIAQSVRQAVERASADHREEMKTAIAAAIAEFKKQPERSAVRVSVPDVPAQTNAQPEGSVDAPVKKRKKAPKVKFIVQRDADGVITGIEAE